jgi:hypothetical protein
MKMELEWESGILVIVHDLYLLETQNTYSEANSILVVYVHISLLLSICLHIGYYVILYAESI